LLFAAIIFEGGIIGFDSNTQTGGVGAGLLGIRADVKYRLDTITVYLRAVSTKTGQVLASVTTHKTIASVGVQGGVFKYVAFDEILEAEAGVTKNEPDQLAVQQAIEKAVHTIVVTGAEQNIWSFADGYAQAALVKAKDEAETRTASITPPRAEAKPQAALQEEGWTTTSVTAVPVKTTDASENSTVSKQQFGEKRMASESTGESASQGWGGILMTMNRGQEDQEVKRPE
jgi:curli production assembly/transport component CsgG